MRNFTHSNTNSFTVYVQKLKPYSRLQDVKLCISPQKVKLYQEPTRREAVYQLIEREAVYQHTGLEAE